MIRPGDANEVVEAWRVIMQLRHQPAVLVLTRQDLPTLDRTKYAPASGLAKGAYILADAAGRQARRDPDGHRQRGLALRRGLREARPAEGIKARVVSMPCWELFDDQDPAYRDQRPARPTSRPASRSSRPPPSAGASTSAPTGTSIGMRTFGASAPLKDLLEEFGFTADRVADAARKQVKVAPDLREVLQRTRAIARKTRRRALRRLGSRLSCQGRRTRPSRA